MVSRRRLLAAGTGLGLVGVPVWYRRATRNDVDHVVVATNADDASHRIRVETDLDGTEATFGPETLERNGRWEVVRFDSGDEFTIEFDVDGDRAWTDTHEIPRLEGSRSSIVLFEIGADGEAVGRVLLED